MSATARELRDSTEGAHSQLLVRQLNEQIRSLAGPDALDIVCECVNGSCFERLIVSLDEYEAVRRFPTRFVVKEGHVAGDIEREVVRLDGAVVVEKSGPDAEQAILFDPRRYRAGADADRALRREMEA